MINFFHKLLNPHCPDCRQDELEARICSSCETLRSELASVRHENQQLLKSLLEITSPIKPVVVTQEVNPQPLQSATSWRVRKQMLETEDRRNAEIIRQNKIQSVDSTKSTEQLEKELLGDEADAREIS